MHIVVTYDVSDDRLRPRLYGWLQGYLWPVQKSVFEGDLDDRGLHRLLAGVRGFHRPGDRLRVYTLCAACAHRTRDLAARTPSPWAERVFVV